MCAFYVLVTRSLENTQADSTIFFVQMGILLCGPTGTESGPDEGIPLKLKHLLYFIEMRNVIYMFLARPIMSEVSGSISQRTNNFLKLLLRYCYQSIMIVSCRAGYVKAFDLYSHKHIQQPLLEMSMSSNILSSGLTIDIFRLFRAAIVNGSHPMVKRLFNQVSVRRSEM